MKANRVALIGLDGSGKSANIDIMKKDADYSEYIFTWVRWKPTLLRPLYKVMGKKVRKSAKTDGNVSTGIESRKDSKEQIKLRADYNKKAGIKKKIFKNPLVRRAWIGLATFDYFLQFYAKTLGSLILGRSMIFDRYYLDLYVDQGINFGYTPNRIAKEIDRHQWLFPKMSKVVYIKVQPETCYMRKDDIPNMDYLNSRYKIYEFLAKKDNWKVIDGEKALQEVNANIKSVVLELAEREV